MEDRQLHIVAASNAGGLSVGSRMETEDFGQLHRLASKAGETSGQKYATIRRASDAEAVSDRNSAIANTILMSVPNETVIQTISAAACFCGPFETKKDPCSIGLDDRPFQDLFRTVPVTGPFNYVNGLTLGDVSPGVNLWDCVDQEAVDPDVPSTWKPCVDLDCVPNVQVDPYAVVACGNVSTFQQLSHPELVDDFIKKLGIVYARRAEQALLDAFRATSTVLTYNAPALGLLWELEQILGHLASISTYGNRIDWSGYAVVLPPGLREALIADEHLRGFTIGATWTQIVDRLQQLGVGRVVEIRDVDTIAEAAYTAAIATFTVDSGISVPFNAGNMIGTWTLYVVPINAYSVGLSTMVEAGWTRDADLIRQNRVQYFVEGLEYLEKMCPNPSYTIELAGCADGGTSALATPPVC